MNINWKIRLKNPSFWISILISIITPILAYMGLTAQDITSWQTLGEIIIKALANPYVVLVVAGSVYNTIIDPTTTGITDSRTALNYKEPNGIKK